jgi:COMPASS component SWD1
LNLTTSEKIEIPTISDLPLETQNPSLPNKKRKCVPNVIACSFDRTSSTIITGNGNGILAIFDSETLSLLRTCKIPGGSPINAIWLSPKGDHFLANSDKSMKLIHFESLAYVREFKDPINQPHWKTGTFSYDQEYIIAGSADRPSHKINVWSFEGILEKTLEGPQEGVMNLQWHPRRPVIASCSSNGAVFIWAVRQTENWSAFAPDFQELTENVPYIEREDEFDVEETETKPKGVEDLLIEEISDKEPLSPTSEDEVWYLPPIIPLIAQNPD